MAYRRKGNNNTRLIASTLGGLVGLVLGLYVFNQILDSVIPLLYTCLGNGTYFNTTSCCVSALGTDCVEANYSATQLNYFGTTANFVQDLLPIVGIIGGYLMIRMAINRMSY